MAATIAGFSREIGEFSSNASIYLPGGAVPAVGEIFVQSALASTLAHLCDVERAHARQDRRDALDAVRDCFYRGDIARSMVDFQRDAGGLLTADDLFGFRVEIEPAVRRRFRDIDVDGCKAWYQGPMLLQQLAILDQIDLRSLGHDSPTYLNVVAEAIKLAAADREAYYGDPRFVDVPLARLLSTDYATERWKLIDTNRAFPDLPPPGLPRAATVSGRSRGENVSADLDTSYVCAVDRFGNAFSATPGDPVTSAPVVPKPGFVVSPRGGLSWTDPRHPAAVTPGKRSRLTSNPAIAIRLDGFVMPFGTPGHDSQTQVMLQAFLNAMVFDMDLQEAVDAPRLCSLSFPSSASPHASQPGRLLLEAPLFHQSGEAMARLGHRAEEWPLAGPEYLQNASTVCAIRRDLRTGVLEGAADHRRPAYAVGW